MSNPIGPGIPDGPPPTLAPRRKTCQLFVGPVGVGSEHPISVQSMTTKTHDINATLQQIAQLICHRLRHRSCRLPKVRRCRGTSGHRQEVSDPGYR